MVIASIEKGNLYWNAAEGAGGVEAAKTTPDDYDVHLTTILDLEQRLSSLARNAHCTVSYMTMTNRIASWAGARLSRRVSRSLPWIGAAIAVATVAGTIRRKGVISGALDTGLNSVPFVGAAKNIIEVARGRDFFPDKYGPGTIARR